MTTAGRLLEQLARRHAPSLVAFARNRAEDLQRAWEEAVWRNTIDYHSGLGRPADLEGVLRAHQAPGVSLETCSSACLEGLGRLSGRRVPVFVDSGAYSEFTSGHPLADAEWRRRLAIYAQLGARLGPWLSVVAPDAVGDQTLTLKRLHTYAPELKALLRAGVRVLVPLQGGALPVERLAAVVDGYLGPGWIPAFPANRAALSIAEMQAVLHHLRPVSVHLLGLGRRRPGAEAVVEGLRAVQPGLYVTMDSNKLRAVYGAGRALTEAEAKIREEFSPYQAEQIADYTDNIAFPSEWMTPAQVAGFCEEVAPSDPDCPADVDAWIRVEEEPGEGSRLSVDPVVGAAVDARWEEYMSRISVAPRRTEAVEAVMSERFPAPTERGPVPVPVPVKWTKRLRLIRARPTDANAYVAERHYLGRGRSGGTVAYWAVADVSASDAAALDGAPASKAPPPLRWRVGGHEILGAVQYALPRVSVRLYGYAPLEVLELSRLYVEPETAGGRNPPHLAGAILGASRKRVVGDWRDSHPNLPAPRAIVSWADRTEHEGTIYKATGFIRVGQTEDRRARKVRLSWRGDVAGGEQVAVDGDWWGRVTGGRAWEVGPQGQLATDGGSVASWEEGHLAAEAAIIAHKSAGLKSAGASRSTVRHADTGNPKDAYVLPLLPPEPRSAIHLRFIAHGLTRESADSLCRSMRDHAGLQGFLIPGLHSGWTPVGTQRARERGCDYVPEWHAVEIILPLIPDAGREMDPEKAVQGLVRSFAREVGGGGIADIEFDEDFEAVPAWSAELETVNGATYQRAAGGGWDVVPVARHRHRLIGDEIRAW